jgi:hypothetical protein
MKSKTHMLSILSISVLFFLTACSKTPIPSEDVAKDYFIEKCISRSEGESLSGFKKNIKIDFKIISKTKNEDKYDFKYQAEIKYLKDGYSYRKNEKQYYEGIVNFIKDIKGWIPENVTTYDEDCSKINTN